MRITHLSAAALLIALTATSAHAQSVTATQDIALSASVPKICAINKQATGTPDSATITTDTNGNVNSTVVIAGGGSYASVVCNVAANVTLTSQSGALVGPSAPSGSFTNIINYTASATLGSANPTLNTATVGTASGAESGSAVSTGGPVAGTLTVAISATANTLPLTQGSYSDTLRITLTPQ